MGVQQILPALLKSAGRPVDIRSYAAGVSHSNNINVKVPLRIGVDVSHLIHKAAFGLSELLNDPRHASNFGRAELLNSTSNEGGGDATSSLPEGQVSEFILKCCSSIIRRLQSLQDTTKAELLIVLDGVTPPVKEKESQRRARKRKAAEIERDAPVDATGDLAALDHRWKMGRRAGAGQYYPFVIARLIQQMRWNKIPFLVAPYEADGQLAYLSLKGYIDIILTEDSDLLAYGASSLVFKVLSDRDKVETAGILIRNDDMGAKNDTANSGLDLTDFSPVMMAVMCAAVGSDYNEKLNGIGIITACTCVRESFLKKNRNPDGNCILEDVFDKLFRHGGSKQGEMDDDFKFAYKRSFLEALLMFRHPVVFDPFKGLVVMGDAKGDPELISYGPYADLLHDVKRREAVVGAVFDDNLARCIAEGWISANTLVPYDDTELPTFIREVLAGAKRR